MVTFLLLFDFSWAFDTNPPSKSPLGPINLNTYPQTWAFHRDLFQAQAQAPIVLSLCQLFQNQTWYTQNFPYFIRRRFPDIHSRHTGNNYRVHYKVQVIIDRICEGILQLSNAAQHAGICMGRSNRTEAKRRKNTSHFLSLLRVCSAPEGDEFS